MVSPGLIVKVIAPLLFPPVPYPLPLQSNPSGSKYLLNKSSWSRHWNPPNPSALLASVPTLGAPFYMRVAVFHPLPLLPACPPYPPLLFPPSRPSHKEFCSSFFSCDAIQGLPQHQWPGKVGRNRKQGLKVSGVPRQAGHLLFRMGWTKRGHKQAWGRKQGSKREKKNEW